MNCYMIMKHDMRFKIIVGGVSNYSQIADKGALIQKLKVTR